MATSLFLFVLFIVLLFNIGIPLLSLLVNSFFAFKSGEQILIKQVAPCGLLKSTS